MAPDNNGPVLLLELKKRPLENDSNAIEIATKEYALRYLKLPIKNANRAIMAMPDRAAKHAFLNLNSITSSLWWLQFYIKISLYF